MGGYIQVVSLIVVVILLFWFGYTLFFGAGRGKSPRAFGGQGGGKGSRFGRAWPGEAQESYAGAAQTCPVCAARLREGELVSSAAFPSFNNGKDRMMHIKGCVYCLSGERDRICPVCGVTLNTDEILVCRLFERPFRRSHVHVIGCSRCKKVVR
jgi:RNA polymerase subunit RPABC4/transcription elongation factor Spt4